MPPPDGLTGGTALQAYLNDLAKKLDSGGELRVGFLEGSTEEDGTSIPMIAAIQEWGAPAASIPPRPFFRYMILEHSGEWGEQIAKLLAAHGNDAHKALSSMGEVIKGQLQDSIIATVAPPLSPVTLMLRKMRSEDQSLVVTGKTVAEAAAKVAAGETTDGVSEKPLVDSGAMLASVDYEVTDGGGGS